MQYNRKFYEDSMRAQEGVIEAISLRQRFTVMNQFEAAADDRAVSVASYPSQEYFQALGRWIGESPVRGNLFTDDTMLRREGSHFGVARSRIAIETNYEDARQNFLREWPERLQRIANRLNEHPDMAGLPKVQLVDEFGSKRFVFAIRMVP